MKTFTSYHKDGINYIVFVKVKKMSDYTLFKNLFDCYKLLSKTGLNVWMP